ncbi:MAG: hypothetical protein MI863_09080 [Desulfobacterales bacterium]|nr:hypothetical protein [Desulfobacterales bacterium]
MGIKDMVPKKIKVLLFFSLALNLGVMVTASGLWVKQKVYPKAARGRIVQQVLSEMDLPESVRQSVASEFKQMRAIHRSHMKQLKRQREAALEMFCRPGPVDKAQVEVMLRVYQDNMAEYTKSMLPLLIEVQKQLGEEERCIFFRKLGQRIKRPINRGD